MISFKPDLNVQIYIQQELLSFFSQLKMGEFIPDVDLVKHSYSFKNKAWKLTSVHLYKPGKKATNSNIYFKKSFYFQGKLFT